MTIYLFTRSIVLLIDSFKDNNITRPVLVIVDFGLDKEKYYYLILLTLHLVAYLCATLTVNGAMILSMLLEHACGMFEIIGHKMTTALNENQDHNNKFSSKNNLQQEIIICVKMHKKVLLFVDDIHKLYSTAYFLIFGLCILDLSITGVQTVMFINNAREAARFGFHTFSQAFHLFLLTIPTQHLLDVSLCISDCIYCANWFQLSIANKKSLLIIMKRAAEPTKLIVGGVFTVSLEFFKKVISTSISYFTVFLAVRK
ncbi:odorant receptor 49b-like [Leptopilina boulardi]|uniref:odorant receptor 49b-like n=1 Tax=Leptopilina boulardi TaxID=63433 RepID=UPI0021F5BF98|nr:odorant receptor 49b-like [Leptopilina boulardi]